MAQDRSTRSKVDLNEENLLSRLRKNPQDVRGRIKLAELYFKRGDRAQAISQYIDTAKIYADQGFHPKAIAVYKQVINLAPQNIEVFRSLIELYKQLGLSGEIVKCCKSLAALYEQDGRTEKALQIIQQMTDLEPGNLEARIQLAGKYFQADLPEKGREAFRRAITLVEGRRSFPDIRSAYEIFFADGFLDPVLLGDFEKLLSDNDRATEFLRFVGTLKHDLQVDPVVIQAQAHAMFVAGSREDALLKLRESINTFEKEGRETERARAARLLESWRRPKDSAVGGVSVDDLFERSESKEPQAVLEVDVFGENDGSGRPMKIEDTIEPIGEVFEDHQTVSEKEHVDELDVFGKKDTDRSDADIDETDDDIFAEMDLDSEESQEEADEADSEQILMVEESPDEEDYQFSDDTDIFADEPLTKRKRGSDALDEASFMEVASGDDLDETDLSSDYKGEEDQEDEQEVDLDIQSPKAYEDNQDEDRPEYFEVVSAETQDQKEMVLSEKGIRSDQDDEQEAEDPEDLLLLIEEDESELTSDLDETYPSPRMVNEADRQIEDAAAIYLKHGLTDKALDFLQSNREKNPDSFVIPEKIRAIYLEQGDQEAAQAELEMLIRLAENKQDSQMQSRYLSEYLKNDPDNEQINIKLKNLLVKSNPDKAVQRLHVLAEMSAQDDDFDKTKEWLEEVLEIDPTSRLTFHKLAELYQGQDQTEKAIEYYYHLADLAKEAGDYQESKEVLKKILALDETQRRAQADLLEVLEEEADKDGVSTQVFSLAGMELAEKNYDEAEKLLRKAIDIGIEVERAHRELHDLFIAKEDLPAAAGQLAALAAMADTDRRYEEAEQLLLSILDLVADDIKAHEGLKDLYLKTLQNEKAIIQLFELVRLSREASDQDAVEIYLNQLIDLDPNNEKAYQDLVDLYQERGDSEKAVYQMFNLANISIDRNQDNEAEQYLRRVVEADPNSGRARNMLKALYQRCQMTDKAIGELYALADLSLQHERKEAALENLNEILQLDSDQVKARRMRKDLFLELDKQDEAKDDLFSLGEVLAKQGDAAGAAEAFEEILEIEPDSKEAYARLKDLFLESDQMDRLTSLLAKNAQRLEADGEHQRASVLYEEILEHDPTNLDARLHLKDLYIRLSIYEKAVDIMFDLDRYYTEKSDFTAAEGVLLEVLRIDRSHEQANLRLKELYTQLGRNDEAIEKAEFFLKRARQAERWERVGEIAKEILGLSDSHLNAKESLAEALVQQDRTDEAIEQFDGLIDSAIAAKDLKTAEYNLRRILALKEDAIDFHRKLVQLYIDNRITDRAVAELFNLVDKYQRSGQTDEAEKGLLEILELEPEHVAAFERLIELHTQLDQKEQAIERMFELDEILKQRKDLPRRERILQDLVALDPKNKNALRTLTDLYKSWGEKQKATQGLYKLTDVSIAEKDWAEAQLLLREIIELDSSNEKAWELLVDVHQKLDQPDEVKQSLLQLADLLYARGNRGEAESNLRKVLRLEPNNRQAHQKLKEQFIQADEKQNAVGEILRFAAQFTDPKETEFAQELLNEALELDPTNQAAHLRLKEIHLAAGDQEAAVDELFALTDIANQDNQIEYFERFLREILAINPTLERAHETLLDFYVTGDAPDKAVSEIFRYAEGLNRAGNEQAEEKAYRQAIQVSAANQEARRRLLEIYRKSGRDQEAIQEMFALADLAAEHIRPMDVEQYLRLVLATDRHNKDAHRRLREFYIAQGRPDRAINELLVFSEALRGSELAAQEEQLLKQVLEIDEANEETRKRLVRFYRNQGDVANAVRQLFVLRDLSQEREDSTASEAHLRDILAIEPGNLDAREQLRDQYQKTRNTDGAVEQLFILAEIAKGTRDNDLVRQYLDDVLAIIPRNEKALQELGKLFRETGNHSELAETLMSLAQLAMERQDFPSSESLLRELVSLKPDNMQAHQMLTGIYESTDRKDLASRELLVLASKAAEVKDRTSALALLRNLLRLDPENIQAYRLLKVLHLEMGNDQEALTALYKMVEIAGRTQDEYEVENSLQEILKIDPARVDVHKRLKDLYFEAGESHKAIVELFFLADEALGRGDQEGAIDFLSGILDLDRHNEEARRRLKESYLQQGKKDKAVEQLFLMVEESMAKGRRMTSERHLREIFLIDSGNEKAKEMLADLFLHEPSEEDNLDMLFNDADKAIAQARKADAEELLTRILAIDPENILAREKLHALKISIEMKRYKDHPDLDSMFQVVDVKYEEPDEIDIDWTDEKIDMEKTDSGLIDREMTADIPELFRQAGVEGATAPAKDAVRPPEEAEESAIPESVDAEDAETHFNLGLAYLEVELYEEATKEFTIASKDEAKEAQALAMLGKCSFELGHAKTAIEQLKNALQLTGFGEEQELESMYLMAMAHLELADRDAARTILEQIMTLRSGYQDVEELLKELK